MNTLQRDIRQAGRKLAQSPGFAIVAIATLALGIGANTAIFSVVNSVLLQPLPYSQPDRLVQLMLKFREGTGQAASIPKFMAWKEHTDVFQYMCAYDFSGPGLNISGGSMPEQVKGIHVSADFFPVFDAKPALGRVFSPDEDRPGGPALAVMSHGLWVRRFGSDRDAIGPRLGAQRRTLHRDWSAALFVPFLSSFRSLSSAPGRPELDESGALPVSGRAAQARHQLGGCEGADDNGGREIPPSEPRRHGQGGVGDRAPFQESMVGDVKQPLLILLGAVGAGSADCMRERGQSAVGTGNSPVPRDRNSQRAGRRPMADRSSIADRKHGARTDRRRGRLGGRRVGSAGSGGAASRKPAARGRVFRCRAAGLAHSGLYPWHLRF